MTRNRAVLLGTPASRNTDDALADSILLYNAFLRYGTNITSKNNCLPMHSATVR